MSDELGYLLRLIDDDDAREGVELALLEYLGDVSDELAGLGVTLSDVEEENLSKLLQPGRELRLRDEWVVPETGLNGVEGDWERFEALLRVVSDFLHDGVSLRPSLSDELDDLAKELEGKYETPLELAEGLFGMGRFVGNQAGMSQVENSDLTWCLLEGKSNPLGLALIYLLVGRRLGMEIYGCNYPGHFLAMVDDGGVAMLVDCYHAGRTTRVADLVANHPELSSRAKSALSGPCTMREMLMRLLANLVLAMEAEKRTEDVKVVKELMESLHLDES